MSMPGTGWRFMQDGVVFLTANHQGGTRGGDELAVQNWWMGMIRKNVGRNTFGADVMMSLEPATLGDDGYREIFQSGETIDGFPIIDHQHPHDFLMRLTASWRMPIGRGYSITVSGGPVGEAALGPEPFMHRQSALDNPTAPLSHHTLDSTHIASSVMTAGIDRGPWQVESSVFHGAEPDENRWDLDFGRPDSWSVRGWYRPNSRWTFQASHGFLMNPEASETGDIRRTTASVQWQRVVDARSTYVTAAYGRNNEVGGDFNAFLAEATQHLGPFALYTRVESLQVEDDLLQFGVHGFTGGGRKRHVPETGHGRDLLTTVTLGGTRTIVQRWGTNMAAGADVTCYAVPDILKPQYTSSPVSFHVFWRVRLLPRL
jgi:hypothetical protein